jgi:hypothetical protein
MDSPLTDAGDGDEIVQLKLRTAALSLGSNSVLILLKVVAGSITGSVAILTEAVHSSIDLVASVVAFFSVHKAGEPADESHRAVAELDVEVDVAGGPGATRAQLVIAAPRSRTPTAPPTSYRT